MFRQRAKRTYTHIWARRCTNNKFKIQSKLVKIRRILPRAGGFAMVFFFVKKKKENWLISNYLWYVLFRVAFLHLCPPCPSTRPSISTRSCSPLSFGLSANLSARHSDSTEIIQWQVVVLPPLDTGPPVHFAVAHLFRLNKLLFLWFPLFPAYGVAICTRGVLHLPCKVPKQLCSAPDEFRICVLQNVLRLL